MTDKGKGPWCLHDQYRRIDDGQKAIASRAGGNSSARSVVAGCFIKALAVSIAIPHATSFAGGSRIAVTCLNLYVGNSQGYIGITKSTISRCTSEILIHGRRIRGGLVQVSSNDVEVPIGSRKTYALSGFTAAA